MDAIESDLKDLDKRIAKILEQIELLRRERDQLEDKRWGIAQACSHEKTHTTRGMTWCDICGSPLRARQA